MKVFIWDSCSFSVLKSAMRYYGCWSIKREKNGTEGSEIKKDQSSGACLPSDSKKQVNREAGHDVFVLHSSRIRVSAVTKKKKGGMNNNLFIMCCLQW